MSDERLARTQTILQRDDVDALLVGPSADLRWLVGYNALPLERLTLLVVPADGDPQLVVPALEAARARESGAHRYATIRAWDETDDPVALVSSIVGRDGGARIAVQDRLWTSFTLALQAAIPTSRWIPGSEVMRDLRLIKSAEEQQALREVGAAIDRVHERVPDLLRVGRTEREVGRDIAELILVDHDEVNFVIVGSGPNGASPHHETGERVLTAGDPVVVDIGGTRAGYCSDCTRNYVVGDVPADYVDLHVVLEDAQERAVAAVRPGVTAEAIDAAAREPIVAAGYGELFIHRTGHGIGVEEHEEPWIVAGNRLPLEPGMAFSVEPGIYVPDRFGARIEDIVLVTGDGVERVNHRPRGLIVAG